MHKREIRLKIYKALFFLCIYIVFLIFYTRIMPIVLYNMDDWHYIIPTRQAWPKWGGWNPSRILPETLAPLSAAFGAFVIYPFTGAFRAAIEFSMAATICAFVTCYAYQFYQLCVKRWHSGEGLAALYTLWFLLLHFLIFRTGKADNDYLLAGYYDTITFFYYLIPALLNGTLIMYFLRENYLITCGQKSLFHRGMVALGIYLGIFSNLYQGAMLGGYVAWHGIEEWIRMRRSGESFRKKAHIMRPHLLILCIWAMSLIFEFNGKRSSRVQAKGLGEYLDRIKEAAYLLKNRLMNLNGLFLVILIAAVMIFLILSVRNLRNTAFCAEKRTKFDEGCASDDSGDWKYLAQGILMLIFLFFSCAFSNSAYIQRGDVLISCFFFVFLFVMRQIVRMNQSLRGTSLLVPVLILFCLFQTVTNSRTFRVRLNVSVEAARAITDDIIQQMVQADEEGRTEMTLYVPVYDSADNWPISNLAEKVVPRALYAYRVTEHEMSVKIELSPQMNEKYGLKVP